MSEIIRAIEAKRDGYELRTGQIFSVINGYTQSHIPDYQMSSFLMAVVCRGMTNRETVDLTRAMLETGIALDLSSLPGIKLDKHSTGGVGDKVSLALVPIVAAAAIPIAKMSGRGLGHTGGTLDKLESIPGFNVNLSTSQILDQVRSIGACLCAQTSEMVPADKVIYALRDVTGTVESIPLIAASIMSKKIAGGADIILLDVKVGRGAFMKSLTEARELAVTMANIGEAFGKKVICEITSMDQPLGQAIGNLIEVKEIADLLRRRTVDKRLKDLVIDLSNTALQIAGSEQKAERLIEDGYAWKKFSEIVVVQGGDIDAIDRWSSVKPLAKVTAAHSGYVVDIDAQEVGRAAMELGAGRQLKEDCVDPLAGIWIDTPVGTHVEAGATLATLYGLLDRPADALIAKLRGIFKVEQAPRRLPSTILERIPAA